MTNLEREVSEKLLPLKQKGYILCKFQLNEDKYDSSGFLFLDILLINSNWKEDSLHENFRDAHRDITEALGTKTSLILETPSLDVYKTLRNENALKHKTLVFDLSHE